MLYPNKKLLRLYLIVSCELCATKSIVLASDVTVLHFYSVESIAISIPDGRLNGPMWVRQKKLPKYQPPIAPHRLKKCSTSPCPSPTFGNDLGMPDNVGRALHLDPTTCQWQNHFPLPPSSILTSFSLSATESSSRRPFLLPSLRLVLDPPCPRLRGVASHAGSKTTSRHVEKVFGHFANR